MCGIIIINKGEKEIESPRQFVEHFGFELIIEDGYNSIEMDACLCQVDCEKTLLDNNIPYKTDWSDIYVGMLDEIILDDGF
jgi:hypothetical protein